MAFDILIKNGTIIDGTGGLRYKSDLGITGGKITAIGSLEESDQVLEEASKYLQ